MPAPLSLDLRHRFQRYIEDGLSGREAARRLMISPATGARLAGRVRRGEALGPHKCGRPVGWGKLGPHKAFLLELVEQDPDITMGELRTALMEAEAVLVHETSLSRALRRLGYTYKKSRWWRMRDAAPMSPVPVGTGQGDASLSCGQPRTGWSSFLLARLLRNRLSGSGRDFGEDEHDPVARPCPQR